MNKVEECDLRLRADGNRVLPRPIPKIIHLEPLRSSRTDPTDLQPRSPPASSIPTTLSLSPKSTGSWGDLRRT